jgi:hypothetical protein
MDERSLAHGGTRLGFAAPLFYKLFDEDKSLFTDVHDGVRNTANTSASPTCLPNVPGHPSVVGFDLVGGVGTPSCELFNAVVKKLGGTK